jgi:hypothetical protein
MTNRVLFNCYVSEAIIEKMRGAARKEGKSYSNWIEETIQLRVKQIEKESGKRIRGVKKRPYNRRDAA